MSLKILQPVIITEGAFNQILSRSFVAWGSHPLFFFFWTQWGISSLPQFHCFLNFVISCIFGSVYHEIRNVDKNSDQHQRRASFAFQHGDTKTSSDIKPMKSLTLRVYIMVVFLSITVIILCYSQISLKCCNVSHIYTTM